MRIYFQQRGGHIHMRVFYEGKSGDLVCAASEWEEFKKCFSERVKFIPEAVA